MSILKFWYLWARGGVGKEGGKSWNQFPTEMAEQLCSLYHDAVSLPLIKCYNRQQGIGTKRLHFLKTYNSMEVLSVFM